MEWLFLAAKVATMARIGSSADRIHHRRFIINQQSIPGAGKPG
jgi:hypothetical protein